MRGVIIHYLSLAYINITALATVISSPNMRIQHLASAAYHLYSMPILAFAKQQPSSISTCIVLSNTRISHSSSNDIGRSLPTRASSSGTLSFSWPTSRPSSLRSARVNRRVVEGRRWVSRREARHITSHLSSIVFGHVFDVRFALTGRLCTHRIPCS